MCEQTGYRVKRVEKKKNRKRAKNRPKPGKSFEREDLENAFEITIKAHRIRLVTAFAFFLTHQEHFPRFLTLGEHDFVCRLFVFIRIYTIKAWIITRRDSMI